jgi:hypothetical protein
MRFGMAIAFSIPVLCGALVACDYVRPIEEVCEKRLGPTVIRVKTSPVEYTTDFTKTRAELAQMAPPDRGRIVTGLTQVNIRSAVTVSSTGLTIPVSGKHCLRPAIDVELAFAPMTVYISNEYSEGSCQFSVTMQHELQHVAAYRAFLADAPAEVERDLRQALGDRILYFANGAEASRKMADDTRDRLGPLVEESMKRVAAAQARLDTREEYDRLQYACGL